METGSDRAAGDPATAAILARYLDWRMVVGLSLGRGATFPLAAQGRRERVGDLLSPCNPSMAIECPIGCWSVGRSTLLSGEGHRVAFACGVGVRIENGRALAGVFLCL